MKLLKIKKLNGTSDIDIIKCPLRNLTMGLVTCQLCNWHVKIEFNCVYCNVLDKPPIKTQ